MLHYQKEVLSFEIVLDSEGLVKDHEVLVLLVTILSFCEVGCVVQNED